jgi:hypothetical protein
MNNGFGQVYYQGPGIKGESRALVRKERLVNMLNSSAAMRQPSLYHMRLEVQVNSESGGSRFLRNFDDHLKRHMVSQLRRPKSDFSLTDHSSDDITQFQLLLSYLGSCEVPSRRL